MPDPKEGSSYLNSEDWTEPTCEHNYFPFLLPSTKASDESKYFAEFDEVTLVLKYCQRTTWPQLTGINNTEYWLSGSLLIKNNVVSSSARDTGAVCSYKR